MAWKASIVGTRENPVPNDTMFVTVEFTDGDRSFRREYKITTTTDVAALIQSEATAVDTLYANLPGLQVSVQGVPQTISNFQCRAMLMAANLFDGVDAALKAQGGVALQAWEYSATVHRLSPLVTAMASQLGLTNEQVDSMFIQAAQISV